MKLINLIILLSLLAFPAYGQVMTQTLNTNDLFEGTYWEDYITATSTRSSMQDSSIGNGWRMPIKYYYVTSLDSTMDTIVTKPIENRAFGDHWLSYALVSDSASDGGSRVNPDTIKVYLDIGLYRGFGTVAGTTTGTVDADGILWKNLAYITAGVSAEISFADSTWWTDYPVPWYCYRWREVKEQSNKYYMTDSQFKEDK